MDQGRGARQGIWPFVVEFLRNDYEVGYVICLDCPPYGIKSPITLAVENDVFRIHAVGNERILHTLHLVHAVKTVVAAADEDAFYLFRLVG